MEVGRNFRPSPFGLVWSTIQGVTFVPQAWFLSVTNWSVRRAPGPWPAKRNPSVSRRPLPVCSPLNQPKNAPLEPAVAVIAKLPEAVSLSYKVFRGMFAAYDARVEERHTCPPISPFSFPAKLLGL